MNLKFNRIYAALFAFLFFLPSYSQAQHESYGDRPEFSSPETEKDLSIYNEQRKQLGIAVLYNFSERYKESFPIFKELYQKGNPVAAFYYAECLYAGLGTFPPNPQEAEQVWASNIDKIKALLRKGDGLVAYTMYQAYQHGHGVQQDRQKADFFLAISIKKEYGLAIFDKAKLQEENGQFQQALQTYLEASRKGNPEADFRLGLIYETGENDIKQDYKLAMSYYMNASNYGHPKAMANLGNMYYNGLGTQQNLQEALRYFQKAAEKDNAAATNSLGVMYLKGEGGLPKNSNKALAYFQKSAFLGDITAYNNLGNMYFNGIGVNEDKAKAFEYYMKAAMQKNPEAMYKVAIMYEKGIGVQTNVTKAKKWRDALEREGYEVGSGQ